MNAGVAKLADALDSKSSSGRLEWGFDSPLRHQFSSEKTKFSITFHLGIHTQNWAILSRIYDNFVTSGEVCLFNFFRMSKRVAVNH